jgi:hypothetical protein
MVAMRRGMVVALAGRVRASCHAASPSPTEWGLRPRTALLAPGARVLAWALDRALVPANPCERGGRLCRASRVDQIWSPEDELAFLERTPTHLRLPLLLALLRLPWSAYDGRFIRLRPRRVWVPQSP